MFEWMKWTLREEEDVREICPDRDGMGKA